MIQTLLFSMFIPYALCFTLATAQDCPAGAYFSGKECETCPPGTYQNEKNSIECKPCPVGTYNPIKGAQGIDICKPCPEGTFLNSTGAISKISCKKCPAGKSAPIGSPGCISCPKGKVISLCSLDHDYGGYEDGMCFDCLACAGCPGIRSVDCNARKIELKCYDCNAGYSTSGANALQCDIELSPEEGGMKECPLGEAAEYRNGGYKCQKCRDHTVRGPKDEYCTTCPPGYTANRERGGTECVLCPPGTKRGEDDYDSNTCIACKKGENALVMGETSCVPDNTPCPPNFFMNKNGACIKCKMGERLDSKQGKCVQCLKNHWSEPGLSSECMRCPKGLVVADDQGGCTCPDGWEEDRLSSEPKCRKCRPGTARAYSSSHCTVCSANTIAPRAGLKSCLSCPKGTYQPLKGQMKCISFSCPKGFIARDTTCIDPRTNCPPEHERLEDDYGLASCLPKICPAGTFKTRPDSFDGSFYCDSCSKGMRYLAEKKRCISCPNGNTSDGGLSTECEKCPGDEEIYYDGCRCSSGRQIINGICTRCPRGTYKDKHVGGCRPCPAGTYNERSGSNYCPPCDPGTFSGPQAKSCTKCPKGTNSFHPGASGCVRPGSLKE